MKMKNIADGAGGVAAVSAPPPPVPPHRGTDHGEPVTGGAVSETPIGSFGKGRDAHTWALLSRARWDLDRCGLEYRYVCFDCLDPSDGLSGIGVSEWEKKTASNDCNGCRPPSAVLVA
ncbi:hypothetical protein L249_6648 [Ophiocordyceps polyrhachis-furcata BCC 54312]|uniref:Uncharacterized protein n=1 Tax=Ophiocordyceps polyrhachis-furcata BCC 54312 TaxID=1330021 RepID=A0A367LJL0_9HYPO|nr:hypothetical protein L249_6648 [Ophiocordyceps polyrhachis-furcata BCC 54312]